MIDILSRRNVLMRRRVAAFFDTNKAAEFMSKTLCDLKSLLKSDLERYMRLVDKPTHLCRKCGRVANSKKSLCKATKIREER